MKFLYIAKGSCNELEIQIIGTEIGYIIKEDSKDWLKESEEISAMLGGLILARNKFS